MKKCYPKRTEENSVKGKNVMSTSLNQLNTNDLTTIQIKGEQKLELWHKSTHAKVGNI